jgi:hypothetical protein
MATIPPFEGETVAMLHVPCTLDFCVAATRFFEALDDGEIPLRFLFAGTIFHRSDDGALQVAQVSWDKEAEFRLPVWAWQALMDHYYPNTAWLGLRRDVLERLDAFRSESGVANWDDALERLLGAVQGAAR